MGSSNYYIHNWARVDAGTCFSNPPNLCNVCLLFVVSWIHGSDSDSRSKKRVICSMLLGMVLVHVSIFQLHIIFEFPLFLRAGYIHGDFGGLHGAPPCPQSSYWIDCNDVRLTYLTFWYPLNAQSTQCFFFSRGGHKCACSMRAFLAASQVQLYYSLYPKVRTLYLSPYILIKVAQLISLIQTLSRQAFLSGTLSASIGIVLLTLFWLGYDSSLSISLLRPA